MKRLIIYLKWVEKNDNKIFNVKNYVVKDKKELSYYLDIHRGNILKYQESFFKV